MHPDGGVKSRLPYFKAEDRKIKWRVASLPICEYRNQNHPLSVCCLTPVLRTLYDLKQKQMAVRI